ncbi:MAG: FMN-binding protein [Clostridiaceae bacterium]|nr:FMN-binding protein [Clostridiaceae bacterium]
MAKHQKLAMILLPLLAVVILFGGNAIGGTVESEFYEGAAEGYGGEIRLRVEMSEGEILSIEVLEMNETPSIGDVAIEKVVASIVETQSTDVDTVSGATASSLGTMRAVEKAMAQAPITYPNGTHEGVGQGYNGDIKLQVQVANGKIQNIEVLEMNESVGIGDNAIELVSDRIIESQSTEVDVVSGATLSSRGTIAAVRDALGLVADEEMVEEEEEEVQESFVPIQVSLEDGKYEGIAQGFDGDIKVKVEVVDGEIVDIELVEINDTPDYGDTAAKNTIAKIVEHQSVAVDTVSSATASSQGSIDAVKDALGL